MSNVTKENTPGAAHSNKWTLQNVITLTVFGVIMFIVMMLVIVVASIVLTPIGVLYVGPGITAVLTGSFYMVIATRINKRGVLFFLHLITALAGLLVGHIYVFSIYVLLGVVGELCMLGKDTYKIFWRNCIGFFIYSFAMAGTGILPMLLFRESFISFMNANSNPDGMEPFILVYTSFRAIAIIIVLTAAGAVLGCLIGRRIVNRHVKKAKI
jgi:energy-coupling factor transport system substrate-specific component